MKSGPDGYFVDSAELERLRSDMQALHDELLGMSSVMAVEHDQRAMSGWDVASTVGDFVSGWQATRDRIAEQLASAVEFVRFAVAEYEGTEDAVRVAASDRAGG